MTLADLRRIAVRRNTRVRFALSGGMECVIDEHGTARVAALAGAPDFRLENELDAAGRFLLEPAGPNPVARAVSREELEEMARAGGSPTPARDDD